MLDFMTWRDLAEAYVRVIAGRLGYVVDDRKEAATGTVYVVLRPVGGGCKLCVRLSDHRGGRRSGERLLSIRQQATRRLADLERFLTSGRWATGPGLTE
jgi:hypothetical protein